MATKLCARARNVPLGLPRCGPARLLPHISPPGNDMSQGDDDFGTRADTPQDARATAQMGGGRSTSMALEWFASCTQAVLDQVNSLSVEV